MRLLARVLSFAILLILLQFSVGKALALTTSYHSASKVTTSGVPFAYTNLSNCSSTDGSTCDRAFGNLFGNLFFNNFGDYQIPAASTITGVRIRVTGMANAGLHVGVSEGATYNLNCQAPSDVWTMWSLSGPVITTYNATGTSITNQNLSCLTYDNIKNNNLTWRINYSSGSKWSANIDNFEIAYDYDLPKGPTPTPTPTVTPTPAPFLDLPWDYQGKGLSFNDAALSMSSYFDHEYPFLSSGMGEPGGATDSVREFNGLLSKQDSYSSHDGYDYAKGAKVFIGDPVLAAAEGMATYVNSCTACGNMIVIDHGNRYQTRYMHLQKDGLVTSTPSVAVHVKSGQPIGKVGATGNVSPSGNAGAHIHFGVFEDKNHDGNFNDNAPDGVTDPFGWQSKEADPWEQYSYIHNGIQRTGNKSYYLWKKKLDSMTSSLSSSGNTITNNNVTLTFPQGATNQQLTINMLSEPNVKASASLFSIGPSFEVTAIDSIGNNITQFFKSFTIQIDFSKWNLTRFDTNSISLYSSQDGSNWEQVSATVDLGNKSATAMVNHLTHFALMANRKDITPPTTQASISGNKGQGNWYRSDVNIELDEADNAGGLGVDYTLYQLDNSDWQQYMSPFTVATEGHHVLKFYSVDNDDNIESVQSVSFDIDKTPPTVTINANPQTLWPPNGKMTNVVISGSANDTNLSFKTFEVEDEYGTVQPTLTDFGQTIKLEAKRDGGDKDGREYIIKVSAVDIAGNSTEDTTSVTVPHDKS